MSYKHVIEKLIAQIIQIRQEMDTDIINQYTQICVKNNIPPNEFFDAIGESKDSIIYPSVQKNYQTYVDHIMHDKSISELGCSKYNEFFRITLHQHRQLDILI